MGSRGEDTGSRLRLFRAESPVTERQEKQAVAMMMLASDLGQKYGYTNKKTWGEMLTGGQGHFEKKR